MCVDEAGRYDFTLRGYDLSPWRQGDILGLRKNGSNLISSNKDRGVVEDLHAFRDVVK